MRGITRFLLAASLLAPTARAAADRLKVTVHSQGEIRLVEVVREGDQLYLPLFACGSLLTAAAKWDRISNRWEMRGSSVAARGFLDEPLITISGQPFLVKAPPRLLDKSPYLSIEALRLLGRHGWDSDVAWEPATREIFVRPARAEANPLSTRSHAANIPAVPAGARVVLFDPGHARHSGIPGSRGVTESDLGLRLAAALSATLEGTGLTLVTSRQGDEDPSPSEVASISNAVNPEVFISVHGSQYGPAGITVWHWGTRNIVNTGINFNHFEPSGGWTDLAVPAVPRSTALARRLIRNLRSEGIPATGPAAAPLACLEGVVAPAVVLDFEGLATPEGALIAADDAMIAKVAAALVRTLAPGGSAP